MRTYKFRGKSEYGWRFGDLNTDLTNGDCTSIYDGLTPCLDYEVHPDSVGQYIGIIDASTPPKEIYDGDIIEGKSGIRHLVKYDDDSAAFLAYKLPLNEFDNGCHIENDWVVKFEKKVVGNVFDNPDLIKKEE